MCIWYAHSEQIGTTTFSEFNAAIYIYLYCQYKLIYFSCYPLLYFNGRFEIIIVHNEYKLILKYSITLENTYFFIIKLNLWFQFSKNHSPGSIHLNINLLFKVFFFVLNNSGLDLCMTFFCRTYKVWWSHKKCSSAIF